MNVHHIQEQSVHFQAACYLVLGNCMLFSKQMGDLFYFDLKICALESHPWCNTCSGMICCINHGETSSYFSTMMQGWKPLGALKAFTYTALIN